jgi:ketosteroid isomerase-like protein
MDIEENRQLVLRFCGLLSERKTDKMFALLADDGTWAGVGNPRTFQYGGTRSKAQSVEVIGQFLAGFDEFSFEVLSTTAEGDRVAVEARSSGKGPGAKTYANEYLLHFACEDGKIQRIREFFDQMAVLDYAAQPE